MGGNGIHILEELYIGNVRPGERSCRQNGGTTAHPASSSLVKRGKIEYNSKQAKADGAAEKREEKANDHRGTEKQN